MVAIRGTSRESINGKVLVSSLDFLASSPLFGSVVWSSFFVRILGKGDFLLGFSFVFDSFQFFVPYLLAAPTWSMSVFAAIVAKTCSILSSFLILDLLFESFPLRC